jgi:hypothetical protein
MPSVDVEPVLRVTEFPLSPRRDVRQERAHAASSERRQNFIPSYLDSASSACYLYLL